MVTGTLHIDLAWDNERVDRQQLAQLERTPAGAHVIIDIGQRKYVPPTTLDLLHKWGQTFDLEITGRDTDVLRHVIRAAQGGEAPWEVRSIQPAS